MEGKASSGRYVVKAAVGRYHGRGRGYKIKPGGSDSEVAMARASDLNRTAKDLPKLPAADVQVDTLGRTSETAARRGAPFGNRPLFADRYLHTRLRDDDAWGDDLTETLRQVRSILHDAPRRWGGKDERVVRAQLYEPLFRLLGFTVRANPARGRARAKPDYRLTGHDGKSAALVYPWDRWLDGPDLGDLETPEENPAARVVAAFDEGAAEWIIVTNGRRWRLYSRRAHARATRFHEVDLVEALAGAGDTEPNEAFRDWWLLFRAAAFAPSAGHDRGCWLDAVAERSREHTRQLGERLKERIFVSIFPRLAQGFLDDRRRRLGIKRRPTDEALHDIYGATLTLLYRLLFLLYAESRELLPMRAAPCRAASLTEIKQKIAERAGNAPRAAVARLMQTYDGGTTLYDRLPRVGEGLDRGDDEAGRGGRIARFLAEHKVPDRWLAVAIDQLAREPDEKTRSLASIDYRSLEVRHLGSIYEGLLEFKLRLADEDLATKTTHKKEKYIPLAAARSLRGKPVEPAVRRGEVYLVNDRAERKAGGSYYTPDEIVEYIVARTVGPALAEKFATIRADLRKAGKSESERIDALFDFRALDPAMGSGHFLVAAADFITDRLLAFLHAFPVNPVRSLLDRTREELRTALAEQGIAIASDRLTDVHLLKRHVLRRCIYGVDCNPRAVELAKFGLWLDACAIGAPLEFLDDRLRCGNSLLGATFQELEAAIKSTTNRRAARIATDDERAGYRLALDIVAARHCGIPSAARLLARGEPQDFGTRTRLLGSLANDAERKSVEQIAALATEAGRQFFHWEIEFPEVFFPNSGRSAGFDAVLGNPPYAGHKGDVETKSLAACYEVCRNYANPATAFLERGFRALRDRGRLGMIVPKSLQYVEAWEPARRLLAQSNCLIGIADASQAFDDVLLEQTVCLAAKQPSVDDYAADTWQRDGTISSRRIASRVAESLECWPARIADRSLPLLRRVLRTGPRLREIGVTSQALGYQTHLNQDVGGGRLPIQRGKQIRPLRIDEPVDFIDRSFLTGASGGEVTSKVRALLQPKVVSQNIVAHVTRPKPRVWIISAADHRGVLCLNTISTTIVRDRRYPLDYIAAVLNSTLASWFYTEFVFCRAIRTMHFDHYYAGKLPIAELDARLRRSFAGLARQIDGYRSRGERQRAIDDAVFDAYGLSGADRRFLYDFCYGTERIETVLSGF